MDTGRRRVRAAYAMPHLAKSEIMDGGDKPGHEDPVLDDCVIAPVLSP